VSARYWLRGGRAVNASHAWHRASHLALIAVLLVAAACSSSSSTPPATDVAPTSPSPSGPAMTQEHTSTLIGYRMKYPEGWTVRPATRPWIYGKEGDEGGDGTTDVFRAPGPERFLVSSQALPGGMSDRAWLRYYTAGGRSTNPQCWPPLDAWPTMTIAGQTAYVHGQDANCNFTEAIAIVDGRAYVFTGFPSTKDCCSLFDQDLFDAFVSTITFTPESAGVSSSSS
jgi:hypothetical protein